MELNDKLVEKVATLLKIDAVDLKGALTDISLDVTLPEKIYTQGEVDILSDNIQKEKYEFGKTAGIEMKLKDLKKRYTEDLGVELTDVKEFDELIEKLNDFKTEKLKLEIENVKKDTGQETSSQIEALNLKLENELTRVQALQKEMQDRDLASENKLHQLKKDNNIEKANNSLIRQFSGLQFNVPKHIENLGEEETSKYLKTERNKAVTLFKSIYTVDFNEDGNQIIIDNSTNEVIKTHLQENEKIDNLIMPFAKSQYLNIQSEDTAGRESQKGKGMKLSFKGMALDDFYKYAKEKGIKENTTDFDTAYSEFSKANK